MREPLAKILNVIRGDMRTAGRTILRINGTLPETERVRQRVEKRG